MICKKCNEYFPYKTVIDGKEIFLNNRSYCLKCSPRHSKQGYKIRTQNTSKLHSTQNREYKMCTLCGKKFKWTKNNVCTCCRNRWIRYQKRTFLIKMLGGKCVHCGCSDERCLVFHHIDESTKCFTLAYSMTKNLDLLKQEAKKCVLLCANCHQIHHFNEDARQNVINYYTNSNKNTRKTKRPSKQDFIKQYTKYNHSLKLLSGHYNVSKRSISNWKKYYNIQ